MSITKKHVKLATTLISPEAGKVLAKYRTKSRGHKTAYREDKPIERVVRKVQIMPCFSSCEPVYRCVSLARVKFLEKAE